MPAYQGSRDRAPPLWRAFLSQTHADHAADTLLLWFHASLLECLRALVPISALTLGDASGDGNGGEREACEGWLALLGLMLARSVALPAMAEALVFTELDAALTRLGACDVSTEGTNTAGNAGASRGDPAPWVVLTLRQLAASATAAPVREDTGTASAEAHIDASGAVSCGGSSGSSSGY